MIFGHAPIIIPALLGLPVRFSRLSYLPLVFLHLSLFLRVIGGLSGLTDARRWGGMLNGIAILLFLPVMVTSMLLARKQACTPARSLPVPQSQ